MELITKRLRLRSPEVKDAADYTAIHNSEFVLHYNAMQPTTVQWMEQNLPILSTWKMRCSWRKGKPAS